MHLDALKRLEDRLVSVLGQSAHDLMSNATAGPCYKNLHDISFDSKRGDHSPPQIRVMRKARFRLLS